MIRLDDVMLVAGTKVLLDGATLHVRPEDRIGLIGRNGAGKSTLLKLFAGEVEAEGGEVYRRGGLAIGYLPQQGVEASERTVWDEARSGAKRRLELERALASAESALTRGEPGAEGRLADATEAWRLGDGPRLDEHVGTVLTGLGFQTEDWPRASKTFSGGWRVRIALARLLLGEHDLLLLDEPTNHLDAAARNWLAGWLEASRSALVLVSHDRWLLEQVTRRTVEVRHRKLEAFSGTVTAWLAERERRDQSTDAAATRQDAEVARLERFVTRFGAKATKAAQARSVERRIDKIERIERVKDEGAPRLRLAEPPASPNEQVVLRAAQLGHGSTAVLSQVSLTIERGQRWVLLGPNGAGKSTLLASLAGTLPLQAGRRTVGRDTVVSVYAQDLAQALPVDRTALEHVLATVPRALPLQARTVLGSLGLSGEAALRPIGALSGGEKARVVLAAFALRPATLLLMDEPTNHLDVETAEVLVEALAAFEGALVVASHDRRLVEAVATHVAWVHEGQVVVEENGLREDHFAPRGGAPRAKAAPSAAAVERKDRRALERQLDRLLERADRVQREIDALDARMFDVATDHVEAGKVEGQRGAKVVDLAALFDQMSEIEGKLAGA